MSSFSLAISPCPNDTFIFDAMLHGKIDTEGLNFDLHFADVEELNRSAFAQVYDITKLSFHAFAYASENYALLRSGSALGNNCGPMLIGNEILSDEQVGISNIAIPGKYTTANLLFSLKYPQAQHKTFVIFSQIEEKIMEKVFDAGVIIHENRFTFEAKGLKKIVDLGEYWETTYHIPIPLGGIAVKRSMDQEIQSAIERIIRRSIQYAFDHPEASKDFVHQHSQEMSEEVCRQHIQLYVNQYSLVLGDKGESAVTTLYKIAQEKNIITGLKHPIFIEQPSRLT